MSKDSSATLEGHRMPAFGPAFCFPIKPLLALRRAGADRKLQFACRGRLSARRADPWHWLHDVAGSG
jgi:hypothetical protein